MPKYRNDIVLSESYVLPLPLDTSGAISSVKKRCHNKMATIGYIWMDRLVHKLQDQITGAAGKLTFAKVVSFS